MGLPKIPETKHPPAATYIEGRSPKFKTHTTIGLAKSAISYMEREGYLYEYDPENPEAENGWVLLFHYVPVEAPTGEILCYNCGLPLERSQYGRKRPYGSLRWFNDPLRREWCHSYKYQCDRLKAEIEEKQNLANTVSENVRL